MNIIQSRFVRIDKLYPHHKNPHNDHAVDSIANSIKRSDSLAQSLQTQIKQS